MAVAPTAEAPPVKLSLVEVDADPLVVALPLAGRLAVGLALLFNAEAEALSEEVYDVSVCLIWKSVPFINSPVSAVGRPGNGRRDGSFGLLDRCHAMGRRRCLCSCAGGVRSSF